MSRESKIESLAKKYLRLVAEILASDGQVYTSDIKVDTPLERFIPSDLALRHDFSSVLEKKVGVHVGDSALDGCQTVGDLCRVLAEQEVMSSGRFKAYAITYRDGNSLLQEEIIPARNHEKACEALLAKYGAVEIVGIDRAGDADDEYRTASHRTFAKGFLLPIFVAGLVAVGGVLFLMWRRGLLAKFFE